MDLLSKVNKYIEEGKEIALATVVECRGSTPQVVGAKMVVFGNGSIEGTVGGGIIEHKVIRDALYFIRHKQSGLKEYILTKKFNSLCGGTMKVFIETFNPDKKLIIVGAGHIGFALNKLAAVLNFKVTVIDERRNFANKKRFPDAKKIIVGLPHKVVEKVDIDKNTYIVIVTHAHSRDYEVLKKVVASKAKYIGMIGSQKKIKDVFKRLAGEGVRARLLKQVYAPVGLNLGGDSPEEIALGILAEIISVANNVKGELRFKRGG